MHVDLEDAKIVDIVLVPFDEGAVVHRAIADRHRFGQRPLCQDEAADMLRQVARHPDQLLGELDRALQMRIGEVEAGVVRALLLQLGVHMPPDGRGEGAAHVFGKPHHLADFADRRARAIVDHGRGDPGAIPAVFLVNVLDHLLAPLMLEIDVDVGRLAPLLGDEALEQEIAGRRVDRGDAKTIADRAVRRRSAPLAQDRGPQRTCIIDDVVDGQEIAREVELLDQRELIFELLQHLRGNSIGPALRRAGPGQDFEILLRSPTLRHRLLGIFVAKLVETEVE